MADNMIACIEFLGLPGSGKSYFSHRVADGLRKEGFNIIEPSWTLDNQYGKFSRVICKRVMALYYSIGQCDKAKQFKELIRKCGYSGAEAQSFKRNLLYKAYIVSKKQKVVIMFDEGIAQMAVSLSMKGSRSAKEIFDELNQILQFSPKSLCIRIDCSIDDALFNMDKRASNDSRVEKLSDLESKKTMLLHFKQGCESIKIPKQYAVPFSYDTELTITSIKDYIDSNIRI